MRHWPLSAAVGQCRLALIVQQLLQPSTGSSIHPLVVHRMSSPCITVRGNITFAGQLRRRHNQHGRRGRPRAGPYRTITIRVAQIIVVLYRVARRCGVCQPVVVLLLLLHIAVGKRNDAKPVSRPLSADRIDVAAAAAAGLAVSCGVDAIIRPPAQRFTAVPRLWDGGDRRVRGSVAILQPPITLGERWKQSLIPAVNIVVFGDGII